MKLTDQDIWKNDFVTRKFKREQGEKLNAPSQMSIKDLANTCTYCKSWDNTYAVVLIKRAGLFDQYAATHSKAHRREVFDKACRGFGIQMF